MVSCGRGVIVLCFSLVFICIYFNCNFCFQFSLVSVIFQSGMAQLMFSLVLISFTISFVLFIIMWGYFSGGRFKKFRICITIQTEHFVKAVGSQSCRHPSLNKHLHQWLTMLVVLRLVVHNIVNNV